MGRKTASGLIFSRGGYSLAFGEGNLDNRNVRYCSRLRCSASLCAVNDAQIGEAERTATIRASSLSGFSSTMSSTCSLLKSQSRQQFREKRNRTSAQETTNAESSARREVSKKLNYNTRNVGNKLYHNSTREKKERSESVPTCAGDQTKVAEHSKPESRVVPQGFSEDGSEELGTCSSTLSSRALKQAIRRTRCKNQESTNTSVGCFTTSENTGLTAKYPLQRVGAGLQKFGFRNSKGSVKSDVPSGSSSSNSGLRRRVEDGRKRSSSRESSLARCKSTLLSPTQGLSVSASPNTEVFKSQQASRRRRNQPPDMGVVHPRTRLAASREVTVRQQEQEDDSLLLPSRRTIAQLSGNEQGAVSESSSGNSYELPPLFSNVHRPYGSRRHSSPRRSIPVPAANALQIAHAPTVNGDGNRNFSMERVAQLLLALERIEPDELTYEQASVLENDLLSDTLNFYDQHRDMRMDIDNMSYEELLALEEKIGTVSTALTEEALSSCLSRSTFKPDCLAPGITGNEEEDAKCSICQEEYLLGEDLGKLACSHRYHVACIHQWLRLKNWCPICKASVSSTS